MSGYVPDSHIRTDSQEPYLYPPIPREKQCATVVYWINCCLLLGERLEMRALHELDGGGDGERRAMRYAVACALNLGLRSMRILAARLEATERTD